MSAPVTIAREHVRLSLRDRTLTLTAVLAARLLARRPPRTIARVLTRARGSAPPAGYAKALSARRAVLTVSVMCAGDGCLARAIATALLCRLHGTWPTWRVGVKTEPFAAHAWVEADGTPVDEPASIDYYQPILTVAPLT